MESTSVDAAIVAAIVSVVVAGITTFVSRSTADKASFISAVTEKRVLWISAFREKLASFRAVALELANFSAAGTEGSELDKHWERFHTAYSDLILRLNPDDDNDKLVAAALRRVADILKEGPSLGTRSHLEELDLLIDQSQKMLKGEWDKVKLEAAYGIHRASLPARFQKWFSETYPLSLLLLANSLLFAVAVTLALILVQK